MFLLIHNPIEGIGSFYGGALHPLLVPEQALLLLSASACFSQQGLRGLRRSLPAGLLALLVGVLAQPGLAWTPPQSALLLVAVLLGLGVAAQLRLPPALPPILALVVGGLVGLGTDSYEIPDAELRLFQGGALLGAAFFLVCCSVWFESAKHPWQRIVIRVLGSWSAAAAMIVLAWQFIQTEAPI